MALLGMNMQLRTMWSNSTSKCVAQVASTATLARHGLWWKHKHTTEMRVSDAVSPHMMVHKLATCDGGASG